MALCSTPVFPQDDLPTIVNTATFSADGARPVSDTVTVQMVADADDETEDDLEPPTDITVTCLVPSDPFGVPPDPSGGTPGCDTLFVDENSAGQIIGPVSVFADDGDTEFQLEVGDDRFEIVNGLLKLTEGTSLDYEAEPSLLLTITATDNAGNALSSVFQVEVRDVNEEPTQLSLSNNYVPPEVVGATIGELITSDPDNADEHTYEVIGDVRFVVIDGRLQLVEGAALEGDEAVPLTIVTTDAGGLATRSVFIITTDPDARETDPTPAELRLLAPSSQGESVEIPPAQCSPPNDAVIATSAPSLRALVGPPDLDTPVAVEDVNAYAIGDAIFLQVTDFDQNRQPFVREFVDVTLEVTTIGDFETVRLTETGENTGVFIGFVYTTSQQSGVEDCVLTVESRAEVFATYTDISNENDIRTRIAEISPVGIVFNDDTGEPVDGVIISLVSVDENAPADVRGDGPDYTLYPSAVVSGESITDASGNVYNHGPGEYRFPALPDGQYRIEIFNAKGVRISGKQDDELQGLGGSARALTVTSDARFRLTDASRGQPFQISQGALPRIDIPIAVESPDVDPTPSTIEFLQYTANPSLGETYNVQQTLCVAEQSAAVSELRDQQIPVPGLVNLTPTSSIKAGQPVFIRVVDEDQNIDSTVRERIDIEVSSLSTEDREFLTLTETEADSGIFIGYLQTNEGGRVVGNCQLGVQKDETIRTTYTDAFDRNDHAESFALVDPFGILFSSSTGEPVSGVRVTLIDADTGEPAAVFGDGPTFAPYPNTLLSGGGAVDEAGIEYDFPEGEYRFPFVEPGNYILELSELPADYAFPSVVSDEALQQLPGAPYALNDGSRGEVFEVPVGPAIRVDIPLDEADRELFLSKSASKGRASIGEFVQYRIRVESKSAQPVGEIVLTDTLPTGFRFQSGSLRANNQALPDPDISRDGRIMTIAVPGISGEDASIISYVTEITPGAGLGEAENVVTASGETVFDANTASATVLVTEDFMRSDTILMGRVLYGNCDDPDGMVGMERVRLFLEDGTNVLTDSDGNWHLEGVEPGTHVVQLDVDSLAERHRVVNCETDSTRFAGRSYSQFVDVAAGGLWRADFYVTDAPVPESEVSIKHSVSVQSERILGELRVERTGDVSLQTLEAFYRLPPGWQIVDGSARVDGVEQAPVQTMIGQRWSLAGSSSHLIEFELVPPMREVSEMPDAQREVLRPRFGVRSATLSDDDMRLLDEFTARLDGKQVEKLIVTGFTDSIPIAPQNRHEYANNEALSEARARSVADFLAFRLKVDPADITVAGLGSAYPVATNDTAEGRRANRRVEVAYTLASDADRRELIELRPEFVPGRAELADEDRAAVLQLAGRIADQAVEKVVVVGHSDNVPLSASTRERFDSNRDLSEARADAVAELLRASGIADDVIEVVGKGASRSIADNRSASGRAMNRRVELLVTKAPQSQQMGLDQLAGLGEQPASARVLFSSANTEKGKTGSAVIDLSRLASGRALAANTAAVAKGTWDPEVAEVSRSGDESPDQIGILSHDDGDVTAFSAQNFRVRLDSRMLPTLLVDGEPVGRDRIGITIDDPETGLTLYSFIGVDIGRDSGERTVTLVGNDNFGNERYREEITLVKTGEVRFIRFVRSGEENVADGLTPVEAYVEFLDDRRRPVRANLELTVKEGDLQPWVPESRRREFDVKQTVSASGDGRILFNPVERAGTYRVVLGFNDIEEEIEVSVDPATRDWILVGLGEGTVGYNQLEGNMDALDGQEDEYYEDGRLAFFAKGQVKGEWLLTLAYDSDKQRDNQIFNSINPGQYYTLYGDASTQSFEAEGKEKLYVRVERKSFNATLGDFDTGLNIADLSRYSRTLSGLYVENNSDRYRANLFVSETDQAYVREEIQGNGTSGIYRLERGRILRNSERITLQIRDRFLNSVIVDEIQLSRGIDYNIDYEAGELIFKQPVLSRDDGLNPQFIVAEYETIPTGEENITAGGRIGVYFNDKRGEVGITAIREGTEGLEGDLYGADVTYRFGPATELRAEIATSETRTNTMAISGDAYKVEFEHSTERWDTMLYAERQEGGFGLGQQNESEEGIEITGVDVRYNVSEAISLNAELYRETDIATARSRDVMENSVNFNTDKTNYSIGMRSSMDSGGGAPEVDSHQLTATVERRMLDDRLRLRATADTQMTESEDENPGYPTRVLVGATYELLDGVNVFGEQELTFGDVVDTQSSRAGVQVSPWTGFEASSSVSSQTTESGERMFANYGLRQSFSPGKNWTFDFGMDRAQTLQQADEPLPQTDQVNPDAEPLRAGSDDFTAAYVGANYSTDLSEWVSRIEVRHGDDADQTNVTVGYKRNLQEGVVAAAIFDVREDESELITRQDNRFNLGIAYRRPDSNWIVLNKLDLISQSEEGGDFDTKTTKAVNNLNANYRFDDKTQVSLQYGVKYVVDTIDGRKYSGVTDLIGTEIRRNLSSKWDVGLTASRLHSYNSDATDTAYGFSVGHSFAPNTWASIGYNFEGFRDSDFDESDYTSKGVYLKFRFKFDQNSVRDSMDSWLRGDASEDVPLN